MKNKIIILVSILLLLIGIGIFFFKNIALDIYINMIKLDIYKAENSDTNEYIGGKFVLANKDTLQEIYKMIINSDIQDYNINKSKELEMDHIILPSLKLNIYYSFNEDIGISANKFTEVLVTLKDEDRKRLHEILSKVAKDHFMKIFDNLNDSSYEDKYYNEKYIIDKPEGIGILESIAIKSNEILPLEKVASGKSEKEIIIQGQEMFLVKGDVYYLSRDLIFIKITEEDYNKISDYLNGIKK